MANANRRLAAVLILALVAIEGVQTARASGSPLAYQGDPQAVQEVQLGRRDTANAAWWGFDPEDSTDSLQQAIQSPAKTILVPYMGTDWVVRPIRLASNKTLIFEPGVVVSAKAGSFKGMYDSLFSGLRVENVTLRGYGATLRMRKADYAGSGYTKSEFRHVLNLESCSRVDVLGLSLESSGGDGICLSPPIGQDRTPCSYITIRDCRIIDNHRQGISVISASHLRIDNVEIRGTKGTPPQAAIDFEPAHPRDQLTDLQVRNLVADGNDGGGIVVNLPELTDASPPVTILIDNCVIRRSLSPAIQVIHPSSAGPEGLVEFRGCVVEDNLHAGFSARWHADVPTKIRLVGCKWKHVSWQQGDTPLHLELSGGATRGRGGIEIVESTLYDDQSRMPVRLIATSPPVGPYALQGSLEVVNALALPLDQATRESLPLLRVRSR